MGRFGEVLRRWEGGFDDSAELQYGPQVCIRTDANSDHSGPVLSTIETNCFPFNSVFGKIQVVNIRVEDVIWLAFLPAVQKMYCREYRMKYLNVVEETQRIRRFLGIQEDELIELTNVIKGRMWVGQTSTFNGHV